MKIYYGCEICNATYSMKFVIDGKSFTLTEGKKADDLPPYPGFEFGGEQVKKLSEWINSKSFD